jgi:YfiH family protein
MGNPLMAMNRARFLAVVGAAGWPVMKLNQVHSGIVRDVDDTSPANEPLEGDAIVTRLKGLMLGIHTADCVPILIAEREARHVAAVHAGWRGTAAGITEATVRRLVDKFKVAPANLVAAVGPHIGVCCYEVGEEVARLFPGLTTSGKPHLNLAEANRLQLLNAGIPAGQIEVSSLCTRCREDLFFSYRRDGSRAGRMLAIIGIAP